MFQALSEGLEEESPSPIRDAVNRRDLGVSLLRMVANRRNGETSEEAFLEGVTHTAHHLLGKKTEEPSDEFDALTKIDLDLLT